MGVCLGTLLVYVSTHSLIETAALFFFGVLLNFVIFGFLTFSRTANEDRNTAPIKLRTYIDWLSMAVIVIWLACPWAMYFSNVSVKEHPTVGYPIWMWVFMATGLPAVFGTFWLFWKYTELEITEGKRNFFFRWKLHLWIIVVFIVIPLFMMASKRMN